MMWVAECGYEPRAIMCCTPTARLLIVWTLPPRYRCPLNRLPAPRFLLPRSGLERSDFVHWGVTGYAIRLPATAAPDPERTSALRQPGDPHPFIDDAFDLEAVEGIELPSTLALLLRSDLRSARYRRFEDRLELGPSGDLAADVADNPTEPAA
jgi:hypothetical protein